MMKIHLSGVHMNMGEALKQFTQRKLAKINRLNRTIEDVSVSYTPKEHRKVEADIHRLNRTIEDVSVSYTPKEHRKVEADIHVVAKNTTLHVKAIDATPQKAFTQALKRLQQRLRKDKTLRVDYQHAAI